MNHRFTLTAAIASAAASTALLPLISGGKWFFGGLGAIIVVALVGTATRHRALRALPAVVCLLCALIALALYLNLIYASSRSYLHLIPSPRSLSTLWHSAITALRDTKSQTPPVQPSVGIEFVAGAGIGLVAALTDLIAVRLRRCALAGLPLLVLFSVPIATDTGGNAVENTFVFCVGIAGYLALLSTDGRERLRLWGRLVTPWNANRPDEPAEELGTGPSLRALAASGRRVGLAAVVLALFAPLLIPGLHAQKLFAGLSTGKGNGTGSGGANLSVNPVAEMTGDLRQNRTADLFTYATSDPNPQYLVEEVLGKLTDVGAVAGDLGHFDPLSPAQGIPPVPGLQYTNWPTETTRITMVAAQTLSDGYLPAPYAPRHITVSKSSALRVNPTTLMLSTSLSSLAHVTYSVVSQDVNPSQAQYQSATAKPSGMGPYLQVPTQLKSLTSLARQIAGNGVTPYDKAQALEKWFLSGRFTYNVYQNLPNNPHALYDFLTQTRTGYCQQFSFAMTVLARLLGIPARVTVGFNFGTRTSKGHYRVDGGDAHAWTQLYFPGYGWTTWDPTPPGNGVGQTNESLPPIFSTGGTTSPGGSSSTTSGTSATTRSGELIRDKMTRELIHGTGGGTVSSPVVPHKPALDSSLPIALFVLGALLVIALVSPRVARSVTRRRRWLTAHSDASLAHAAWAELRDDLVDYGVGCNPGETPRAVAKRIGAQYQLAQPTRQALNRLAEAEERASYAPEPAPGEELSADVATVRSAVAGSVPRNARWRARLMPASSAEELRRVAAHALDAFGWLEVAITRVMARLPASRHPRIEG